MKKRNAFYSLLSQYLANQPNVKPRHAWAHFANLAANGFMPDVLISFDGQSIEVRPDPNRLNSKRINRASFARQVAHIKTDQLA